MAVRWAWERNSAPQPDPNLSGVASLMALMRAARSSGVISDIVNKPPLAPLGPMPS